MSPQVKEQMMNSLVNVGAPVPGLGSPFTATIEPLSDVVNPHIKNLIEYLRRLDAGPKDVSGTGGLPEDTFGSGV